METRKQFIEKCINECLEVMFKYSYPSISYKECLERIKLDNKKESIYDKHYLPDRLYKEIVEHFCDVYGFKYYYKDSINRLLDCFENGGYKDVYVKDENETIGHREAKQTPTLNELIGEDKAKLVIELIGNYKNFYRFDTIDRDKFCFNVMNFSPTSNRTSVIEYWKDKEPNFKIPEDEEFFRNYYKNELGFSDEDVEYELKLIELDKYE